MSRKKTGVPGRIARLLILFLIVAAAGTFIRLWDFDASETRFASAGGEDELVDVMIDRFDTGFESLLVRTNNFQVTHDQIASYISAEISNDPEDLCILPESYTAVRFEWLGLWQLRLYFSSAESVSGNENADDSGMVEAPGAADPAVEEDGKPASVSFSMEEIEAAQLQVGAALDRITEEISAEAGAEVADLYRAIFQYLCDHVEYDYELSEAIANGDFENPLRKNRGSYGALVEGRTVCSGYAAAYKAICDRLGLDCWVAASEDHAWNLILVDGKTYCVDATSGDQESWIADQFFMIEPAEYEAQYGYRADENCYIPDRFDV